MIIKINQMKVLLIKIKNVKKIVILNKSISFKKKFDVNNKKNNDDIK